MQLVLSELSGIVSQSELSELSGIVSQSELSELSWSFHSRAVWHSAEGYILPISSSRATAPSMFPCFISVSVW